MSKSPKPKKTYITTDGVELEFDTTPPTKVYFIQDHGTGLSIIPKLKTAELTTTEGLSTLQGSISYYSTPEKAVEGERKKAEAQHRQNMERFDALLSSDATTKQCQCGKLMILVSTGAIKPSRTPLYPRKWWCGGCSRTEKADPVRGIKPPDQDLTLWERANAMGSREVKTD